MSGTKVHSNYEDLLTFTRASKGHALRPVSYGDELVTNGTFDSDATGATPATWETNNANASLIKQADGTALFSSTSFAYARVSNADRPTLSVGIYWVSFEISETQGSLSSVHVGIGATGNTISGDGTYGYVYVSSSEQAYDLQIRPNAGGTGSFKIDNISVKEVTFDQPDGTLTLFEHPVNVPRVEWDSAGNRLGLLVEESRTNSFADSEDFSTWSKLGVTVTAGQRQGPDKLQSMTAMTEDTSNTLHIVYKSFTTTSSTAYTVSFFVVADGRTEIFLRADTSAGTSRTDFDLSAGTVGTVHTNHDSASIEDMGNSIYRVSVSFTETTGGSRIIGIEGKKGGSAVYTGSGTNALYIYGAQLEAGSFPTSYIKTTGATATRSADVASIPVSDFGYNQSAGSLLVQCQHFTTETGSTAAAAVALDDGSSNNRMWYYQNKGQWIGSSGGATQFSIVGSDLAEDTEAKAGMVYSKDDFALYIDGSSVGTKTAGSVAEGVATLHVGKAGGASVPLNGHIKSIKYYPRRLTNAQLQALTEPRSTPTLSLTFDGLESSYTENYIHG